MDASLVPNVADALKLVGFNFTTVSAVFGGREGVEDSEIIDWLREHDAVWVHADDKARREHRKLITAGNVRTVWVYRPKGMMSSAEQLRILAYVLLDLLDQYRQRPSHRHYKVDAHGQAPRTRIRLRRYEL